MILWHWKKKRMQQRYGSYQQFQNDKQNLLPNEFASVTSGDPNTSRGKALYYAFGPGDTCRLMTAEDAQTTIDNAVQEATQDAEQAAESAQEYLKELKSYPKVKNHVISFGE